MDAALSIHASTYPGCAPELIAFRNLNRGAPRDRAYFDWRYVQRPCAEPPIIVWAELAGRRVGALTVFPHDFHVLDSEYPLGILGDISVVDEFRGSGIAGAMFEFMTTVKPLRNLHGCMVLPNESAARALRKSGWHDATRIARFAKILDLRRQHSGSLAAKIPQYIRIPLNVLMRNLTCEALLKKGAYRALLVPDIDNAFDKLWQAVDKSGKVIAVRNARYLRWRYQHHPLNTYYMLAIVHRDTLCGYAMYRLDGDRCVVEDAFCREPRQHAFHVVGLLLEHLREQSGAAAVSMSICRDAINLPLRRFGFMRRADFQRVMTSNCRQTMAGECDLATASWYVTSGDKDV